jgi:Calcium binding
VSPEDECEREVFVEMPWEHKRTPAVPLSQLEVAHTDEESRQAVEGWHYWVARGSRF